MTFFYKIEAAKNALENVKTDYLRRWGWKQTCNTPGSFWLWQRDFSEEDAAAHARWKARGPGPLGMPSEPRPFGIITAPIDLAVSMTARFLDEQLELAEEGDDE
ncbi:hypothetical protein [Sphingopyxis indica]|uniref:Uncharacterized protein n=1 Tax=Sphingopyxis indica TaxID=436663 RepID=A0A239KQF4_9SPHN|nr:hypothetical protein [Sphingopyxis indica]SNT20275.1 hypothetical protein SAMN06295955_115103 [Sphingopyxis indica]